MTNPCQSIDSLYRHLKSCLENADLEAKPGQPLLKNIAQMTFALIAARNVQLPKLALKIPCHQSVPNLIQRLERLLKNPRFEEHAFYAPLAQAILRQSAPGPLRLVLDRTDLNDRHYLLAVSLVFQGRTIPLAWSLLDDCGSSSYGEQEALLERVLPWIGDSIEVVLLADREFDSMALIDFCLTEGWHFCLRLRKNRWLENEQGERFQPKILLFGSKNRLFLNGLHPQGLEGESLSLSCSNEGADAWYILSDLPAGNRVLQHYSHRFCTEETFRDWKEAGFRLEKTHIQVAERVSRLLFCVCLAHLWSLWRGAKAVREGQRRLLERQKKRRLSLLQIGLRLLERAIALGELLPVGTRVRLN